MSDAEDIFSEAFGRFTRNWTFIISLRQVAAVALPIAEGALAEIHAGFVERVSADPEYRKLIVKLDNTESTWDEATKRLVRTGMTEGAITNARAAIDAASLVFAHSVLDDCAWSYLKVCSLANPADWEPIIAKKTTTFAEYFGKPVEVTRNEMIQEKLQHLERGSLLNKVDLLFQICTPSRDFAPIGNYLYDRDRLQSIDNVRNGVIHKNSMGRPVPNIDDDLDFISKTASYLMALVNYKYGVQLKVAKVFNLPITSDAVRGE